MDKGSRILNVLIGGCYRIWMSEACKAVSPCKLYEGFFVRKVRHVGKEGFRTGP